MAKIDIMTAPDKIEGFSVYFIEGKPVIRRKGGPSKERIAKDPALAKVRENASEFANVSRFAKSIFDAVTPLTKGVRDARAFFRLMSISNTLKTRDFKSSPGARSPLIGLVNLREIKLFNGFEFNLKNPLERFLNCTPKIDEASNTLEIGSINTTFFLNHKIRLSHIDIIAARVLVEKSTGECICEELRHQRIETPISNASLLFQFETPVDDRYIRFYFIGMKFDPPESKYFPKSRIIGSVRIIQVNG